MWSARRPVRPLPPWVCALLLGTLGSTVASPALACRFWALIGQGYPQDMIEDHLRSGTVANLKMLGSSYRDGWGFASFPAEPGFACLDLPVIRRGRPPANWYSDYKYDRAVAEMVCLAPRTALAHVRAGSSGHQGIPDPHPFSHERWMFEQNGDLDESTLDSLLSWDNIHYLNDYPPEYVNGYVDSELFFMYLLKILRQGQGTIEESIVRAVGDIANATGSSRRMNFALTAGDTLYALRFATADTSDALSYCPAAGTPNGPRSSTWYVVASQILGSTLQGWAHIPPRSLAVFVPGESPRFIPIFNPASAEPGPSSGRDAGEDRALRLGEAAPNPAPAEVRVPFRLRRTDAVRCDIWSVDGRLTRSLRPGTLAAGEHVIRWDGLDESGMEAPSGQYFWKIQAGSAQEIRRVTLIR